MLKRQRESGDTGPVAEAARADRDPDRVVAQNETEPDDGAAQANADREAERADKEAQIEDAWRRLLVAGPGSLPRKRHSKGLGTDKELLRVK